MVNKIIHQIVGPKRNSLIDVCLKSWRDLKDFNYEIFIWHDALILVFLNKFYPFAVPAFSNARNHGEAADIARYLIVYHFGGCYVDWDIELLDTQSFIEIIDANPNGYLIIDPVNDTLASECFSALEGENYLLSLSEDIVSLYNNNERDGISTPFYSGPYRMRDSLQKHKNSKQTLIPVKEIFLYDFWEIRSKPKKEIKRPLIHYWLHSWM